MNAFFPQGRVQNVRTEHESVFARLKTKFSAIGALAVALTWLFSDQPEIDTTPT